MKLMFHICCAPCGGYLSKEFFKDFQPVLFFYNPNIWPKQEYERRLNEVKKFCQKEKIELIEGEYENMRWFELTKNYEQDPEAGERCSICFQMRLEKTVEQAKKLNIKNFSTSLAISPYKNLPTIKEIGEKIAKEHNLKFIVFNEQEKKDLWPVARQFAHQEKFYHQNYCGCVFSVKIKRG